MTMHTDIDKNKIAFIVITVGAVLSFVLLFSFFLLQSCQKKSEVVFVPQQALPSASEAAPTPPAAHEPPGPQLEITGGDAGVAEVGKAVGRHVFLPTGNVTVTTVENPDALRKENPIFYQYARKGDKVLFYPDRAILYNPEVDRVIDIIHMQPK